MTSYNSAQKRYLNFCLLYNLPPLPLAESTLSLFAAYLAYQGLQPQTIKSYLSALRHLQVQAGLPAPNWEEWARLHYTLRGIQRSRAPTARQRLPITPPIMRELLSLWSAENSYEAQMLWAAACLAFFGFLRSGEFTLQTSSDPPAISAADVSVGSRSAPSVVSVRLCRAKTDPFGEGVSIYLGITNTDLCPVVAMLNYMVARPSAHGTLFVHHVGSPLLKQQFIAGVRRALPGQGWHRPV